MSVYLPEAIAERVATFPETHYGVHTVTVTLADGRVLEGVEVAWGKEVIRVQGHSEIPFDAAEVASVEDGSSPT